LLGNKVDATGCPLCDCNESPPVCTTTGTTSATDSGAPTACNLVCSNGYVVDGGCKICKCYETPPCTCGIKPTTSDVYCIDKTTIERYTDYCVRELNNTCHYYYQRCPIAIKFVITKGSFTYNDLTKFLTDLRVPLDAVSIEINPTKNEVTFYVKQDYIPTGIKDTEIAKFIETSVKDSGSNDGYAFVIQGDTTSTTMGYGNVIVVSLIGLFIALFM